jgi:hypothetical protein
MNRIKAFFATACLAVCAASTAHGQVRVFMAPDGQQGSAPLTGPTTITMAAGGTATLMVWLHDTNAPGAGQELNAYQLIFPWFASDGSSGMINYNDINPGQTGGNSIFVDVNRADWVFDDQIIALPVNYNETSPTIFGCFYATLAGFSTVPAGDGIRYLAQFSLQASSDACGVFTFNFNLPPSSPPLTSLFNPFGGPFAVNEYQPLTIMVSPPNGTCQTGVPVGNGDFELCTVLSDPQPDIWFKYTAPCPGPVTVSTCNQANYDTALEVYQGCFCPPTTLIASNDNGPGCVGGTSELTFNALGGVCYAIRVLGSGVGQGAGTLSIESNTCFIDGVCRAAGFVNPANECEICNPTANPTDWSPKPVGTPCTDDGNECTNNACNAGGNCAASPVPNGTPCTEDGNECTNNQCLGGVCSATPLPNGTPCADTDGEECTLAECAGGNCSQDISVDAGTPCDDGNVCTGTGEPGVGIDECDGAGMCVGQLDPNCQDTCENAAVVQEGTTPGNNAGFGTQLQVSCAFNSTNDAWFVYTAPCTGLVKMTTNGSSFDTVLTVYDDCGGPELACDDDGGPGLTSALEIQATAGQDYFIRMAGFNGASGSFLLNIERLDTCFVDGQCFDPGDGNPDNDCEVCDPFFDSLDFSPRPGGTPCGSAVPDDPQCDSPDSCNGQGVCESNNKPAGASCGDPSTADCDNADVCNGLGFCDDNFDPAGTPCGDPAEGECDHADTCSGAGDCLDNFEAPGTFCGDSTVTQCDNPDTCDGTGTCQDNLQPNGSPCPDESFCNGAETCLVGECIDGPEPCDDPAQCNEDNDICLSCLSDFDCGDLDMNGITDDQCFWYNCDAGVCMSIARPFGDLGGPFGSCPPDQVADNNDRFHALNCFADLDTDGMPPYPCEENPPAAINTDAGGQFGSCCPDGVCDANDAFAALNAFQGTTTCSCPGACPPGPAPAFEPVIAGHASVSLLADRGELARGEVVRGTVLLDQPLDDLRGYQLHAVARGGASGWLELVDISIDKRQDWVFDGLGAWDAFNVRTRQMLAGLSSEGVATQPQAYLATFTFKAGPTAAGTFAIDLLYDDAHGSYRTFLFGTAANSKIQIVDSHPAEVTVKGETQRLGRR